MAESRTTKTCWTAFTVSLAAYAAYAAYAFSFAADIVFGALMGVYPSTVTPAAAIWLLQATMATIVATRVRSIPGWLSVPFIVVTVVVVFGALVGAHPHNWGVAAVMGVLTVIVRRIDAAPCKPPVMFRPRSIDWNPTAHSNDENARWCWLRAVEWGRWPLYLSQTIAPVLLIWLSWVAVVVAFFVANLLWALFIRYRTVSCTLAGRGVYFATARWLTWPSATVYLFYHRTLPEAWVALAWPVVIIPLGVVTPTALGRIQSLFLDDMGFFNAPPKT